MRSAALAFLALLVSCQGNRARQPTVEAASSIAALANAYVEAVLSEDPQAYLTLYDPEALQLPPGGQAVVGPRAIADRFAQSVESGGPTAPVSYWGFSWSPDGGGGDLIYDHGAYVFRRPGEPGDSLALFQGTYVIVLRRRDGDWGIWREAWTR